MKFFSHAEGYVDAENGNKYVYQYKDHLGNIRLSYLNIGTTSAPNIEIQEENNYYPFGLKQKGYNEGTGAFANSAREWKFLGIELENSLELGFYETPFRLYDPTIGRFIAIDALSEIIHSESVYQYGYNSPILYSDASGLFSTFVNIDGEVVEHRDDGDPFVYLVNNVSNWDGSKDGLSILGYEDPNKTYKKGDKYTVYFPAQFQLDTNTNTGDEEMKGAAGLAATLILDNNVEDDILVPIILAGAIIYVAATKEGIKKPRAIFLPKSTTYNPDKQNNLLFIFIDGRLSPEAAKHGQDAIMSGILNTGTLDRMGRSARKRSNLAGIPIVSGKDRDEFPPAVISPDGSVSVRHISPGDNRSAGAQVGAQIAPWANGTRVIVVPINVPNN